MCVFFISIFLLPFCATAAEDKISFAREILPILSDKCFYCHGPDKENQKADLRSDIRDDAVAAGAIDPVHPESIPVLRTKDLTWPLNPIDHFILSQLEMENLKPSPATPLERWPRPTSVSAWRRLGSMLPAMPTPSAIRPTSAPRRGPYLRVFPLPRPKVRPHRGHDFHVTILNQLGIDHTRLTYTAQGRRFRLTDVDGHVVQDLLA